MNAELAEKIGLLRHSIISPVLMDSQKAQMEYFRQTSEREFDVPGRGPRRFTATTMKGWLYRYRRYGFTALVPKTRRDRGQFRMLSAEQRDRIKTFRTANINYSVVKFYDLSLKEGILGVPPICIETLRRFLRSENLYKRREHVARKRFEMSYFGELWTCDFMHGPQVLIEGSRKKQKAILLAMIDDHTRLIVGYKWDLFENTSLIEDVFKEAILSYGLPDRIYCDNGAAFSSHYMARCCAHLNIGLVHSKPYDSPSRGKIERFFRTVREQFLVSMPESVTIDTLNTNFNRWLRDEYHHKHHHGIDGRPLDRYSISASRYPRKRIDVEDLEDFFMVAVERTVNKDSTVSLNTVALEVPPQYIGRKVELRFKQDSPSEVYLYENGIRLQKVQAVDSQLNGKIYKPSPRISDVALHEVMKGERP